MMATDRSPGYGRIDRAYARRLATTPHAEDGPVWMVNLMKYREVADYTGSEIEVDIGADGQSADRRVSGRAADDRYAPLAILDEIGAEVVLVGDVESQLLGTEPMWDRVAVVKYPTRRSFIAMQSRDDFRARHVHKAAGMDKTIVIGCQPADVPAADGVDLPDWRTVAHPPSPDDGPVVVVHVIRFAEGGGRAAIERYQEQAALVAVPHGVRIGGWFDAEGTIVGDGRVWHQVRFNVFPSKAAFMAVVGDPGRIAAQRAHREPAMADTYTIILRPTLNRLDGMP